jgi:hypothetical protein
MLSVASYYDYIVNHCAKCRYAECRGTLLMLSTDIFKACQGWETNPRSLCVSHTISHSSAKPLWLPFAMYRLKLIDIVNKYTYHAMIPINYGYSLSLNNL